MASALSDPGTTGYPPTSPHKGLAPTTSADQEKIDRGAISSIFGRQVFGTAPVGVIGRHKPRKVFRIERDYAAGELPQFWSGYPPELEGRVTATQHARVMNELNATLASAYDPYRSILDNTVAVATLYLSTMVYDSHYKKTMQHFKDIVRRANTEVYNPVGLNILDPLKVAYLFLEIEYY